MRIENRIRVEISLPVRSDLSNYQIAIDWLADEFALSRGGATITTPFSGLFSSLGHAELISDAVRILYCDFELDPTDRDHQAEIVEYLETTKDFLVELLEEEEIWVVFYPLTRIV